MRLRSEHSSSTTRREAELDRFRKLVGRVFRRWFAPRHGWFFITRRTVTTLMQEGALAGPPLKGYELLSVDAAAAVPGACVHRPEPGFPVLELPNGVLIAPKGHAGTRPSRVVGELSFGGDQIGDRRILRESALAADGDVVELPGVTANLAQDS